MASKIEQWGNNLYTGQKSYNVVGKKKIFYIVSVVLCILCVLFVAIRGFNLGIEFRGGSEFTVSGSTTTSQQDAIDAIHDIAPDQTPLVSTLGSGSIRIQTASISDVNEVQQIREKLADKYKVSVDNVANTVIGPSWGASVTVKAVQGLVIFLFVVALFMAFYFRNWRMSLAGIIALLHDLVVTVGLYAAIGWEITPASMIGFLTILGYSMYDTVVVFDKIRENTNGYVNQTRNTYSELANLALNQTLVRSINTSIVGLLPVTAVLAVGTFSLGAGTLRDISLALFIGMIMGAYSSIFIATPILTSLMNTNKVQKQQAVKVKEFRAELLENVSRAINKDKSKLFYNERGEICTKNKKGKLEKVDLEGREVVDKNGKVLDISNVGTSSQYLPGEHMRKVGRRNIPRSKRTRKAN